MFFDRNELIAKKFQVSPRICHGGELLSIWIDAYGKAPATHLWDIAIARAFSNREEIEAAISAEMKRSGYDRMQAARSIILRAGVYDLAERDKKDKTEAIEVSEETAAALRSQADKQGLSIDDFLKKISSNDLTTDQ